MFVSGDRGMLTTHYKYITAEKMVIVCKLDYINLQDNMRELAKRQIEKLGSHWLQIQPLGKFSRQ